MDPDPRLIPTDQLLSHVDGMRRLAHRLVRDAHTADDVTQDAIVVAMSKPPKHRQNVAGWLNGIVRNTARDRARRDRRRANREQRAPSRPPTRSPVDLTIEMAGQKRLIDAVNSLREPYRRTIWRRYVHGLSARAIARDEDVPVETVRTWIKRGRGLLRQELDDMHGGNRRAWTLALAPCAASSNGLSISAICGGALMSLKTKSTIGVLLVLLLGGGIYWMLTRSDSLDVSAEKTMSATLDGEEQGAPTLESPGKPDAIKIVAQPSEHDENVSILGRVIDGHESPVKGATIRTGPPDERLISGLAITTTSRADGTFVLKRPTDGQALRVAAESEHGGALAFAVVHSHSASPLTLRLVDMPRYTFRVLDGATDEPLIGVRCESRRATGGQTWVQRRQTLANGIVTLSSPNNHGLASSLPFRFERKGYTPITFVSRRALGSRAGTPKQPRELYMFRSRGLALCVVDADNRPVEGARVRAWAGGPATVMGPEWVLHWKLNPIVENGFFLGESTTDDKGLATLDTPPSSPYWHARADTPAGVGFAWGNRTHMRNDQPNEIHLERAVTIRGRVLDRLGEPVVGAYVKSEPFLFQKALRDGGFRVPPDRLGSTVFTQSETGGRYELLRVGIPSGSDRARITAFSSTLGGTFAEVDPPTAGTNVVKLDLTFERLVELQNVRVIDKAGAPVSGAFVTWENGLPGSITNAHGEAQIIRFPGTQDLRITVFHKQYSDANVPCTTEDVIEIVLRESVSLSGVLVDPNGDPHEGYIDIYDIETSEMTDEEQRRIFVPYWQDRTTADATGRFTISGLRPGPWFVSYWYSTRKDDKPTTIRGTAVVSKNAGVRLQLPEVEPPSKAHGVVYGEVVDAQGEPVVDAAISLKRPDRTYPPVLQGRRFRFEGVAPSAYVIDARSADGTMAVEVPVVVRTPRDEVEMRVVLEPTLKLEGRLVDESGRGVKARSLQLFRVGQERFAAAHARTAADGQFSVENLHPGRYRIRLHDSSGESSPLQPQNDSLVLTKESTLPVLLKAVTAGRLTTTLEDDRFLPYSKDRWEHAYTNRWYRSMTATVEVVHADGRRWRGEGLYGGRAPFQFPLPSGKYELVVTYKKESFRRAFDIEAGETVEIPITLP